MGDKLKAKRVALSVAIVSFILSVICLLLIAISPARMTNTLGLVFHGIDVSQIAVPISWGNAILGVVIITIIGLIAGWLFAVVYNKIR